VGAVGLGPSHRRRTSSREHDGRAATRLLAQVVERQPEHVDRAGGPPDVGDQLLERGLPGRQPGLGEGEGAGFGPLATPGPSPATSCRSSAARTTASPSCCARSRARRPRGRGPSPAAAPGPRPGPGLGQVQLVRELAQPVEARVLLLVGKVGGGGATAPVARGRDLTPQPLVRVGSPGRRGRPGAPLRRGGRAWSVGYGSPHRRTGRRRRSVRGSGPRLRRPSPSARLLGPVVGGRPESRTGRPPRPVRGSGAPVAPARGRVGRRARAALAPVAPAGRKCRAPASWR
jgi:hypothetical protein